MLPVLFESLPMSPTPGYYYCYGMVSVFATMSPSWLQDLMAGADCDKSNAIYAIQFDLKMHRSATALRSVPVQCRAALVTGRPQLCGVCQCSAEPP